MKRISVFFIACFALIASTFVAPQQAKATHLMGVDLVYQCLNNCTIRVLLRAYRDCTGSNFIGTNVNFVAQTPGCGQPQALGGWSAQVTTEVTPVCPGAPTRCTNPGAAINGVEEFFWYRDYNICNVPNCIFTITWTECCRNPTITSLNNPGGQQIATNATTLNTNITPCNSSPQFSNPPVPYICQGQPYTFNQGAFDPENDSLSYSLGPCYNTLPNTLVTYAAGFSQNAPLGSSWNVSINPTTGDITVVPQPGNILTAVLCVYVGEWRNGVLINTIVRDIQMTVIPCPNNTVPTTPGISNVTGGAATSPFSVTMCAGTTVSFQIPTVDPNVGQTHTVFWNQNIPGATFTNSNATQIDTLTGALPTAYFNWQPTTTGVYTFLVTIRDNACPIPGQNQFTITINVVGGLPGAGITATPTGCTNVSLSANPGTGSTGPYQYVWSGDGNLNVNPNNTTQTFNHTYPGPGTYNVNVQITDAFGCVSNLTTVVIIPNGPTSDGGPDISICSGLPIQLGNANLPLGQTYSWFPSTGLSNPAIATPTFQFTLPGNVPQTFNYTVTATSGFCTSIDYVTVVVYPVPMATIAGNLNICNGQSTTLTAGGGTTFLWSTGATTPSITVSPNSTTTYTVIVNGNGCASPPASATVNVSFGPTAIITGVDSVCPGGSTVLTAAGGSSWLWSTGASTQSITVNNVMNSTTVSVVASQNGCPGPAATYVVNLHNKPVADFGNTTVCIGNTTTFQDLSTIAGSGPSGITAWNWNFNDPLSQGNNISQVQNPTHAFTAAGTYNVQLIIESANGCRDTVTESVIVNPLPQVDFNFDDVCDGTTMVFTDASTSQSPITSWQWNFGSGQTSNAQNPTNLFPGPGLYNVTLTVTNANGCTNSRTKTVIVFPNAVADFTWDHSCWNTITTFTSQASLTDPNGTTLDLHNWNFGDPASGVNNTSTLVNPIHSFTQPGSYAVTLTVTTSRGCVTTIVIPVNVPQITLPITVNDTVCYGEQATLYAGNPDPSLGTLEWFYSIDATEDPFWVGNQYFTTPPLEATTVYFVGLRDIDGCLSPKVPVFAIVRGLPNVDFHVNSQVVDLPNAVVEFTVDREVFGPITSYLWDFGDGSTSTDVNPVHQYSEEGTYDVTLTIYNADGCMRVISLPMYIKVNKIVHIFVPTAFTPNGDGLNDYFEVFTTLITTFHIDIFDRWGKLVFSSDDLSFKWDGKDMPEDAYTYVINAVEWSGTKVRKSGTVTIIR
ncbi:MAG: PKD domain-containing protein [Bacteroidetes bacterium]|nr:PKD domain-containing protein [Bacteroidota bacterium]